VAVVLVGQANVRLFKYSCRRGDLGPRMDHRCPGTPRMRSRRCDCGATLRGCQNEGPVESCHSCKMRLHWFETTGFARPISDKFSSDGFGVIMASGRFVRAAKASSRKAKAANSSLISLSSCARWSSVWLTMSISSPVMTRLASLYSTVESRSRRDIVHRFLLGPGGCRSQSGL
jgi:hypothetical protein